MKKKNSFTNELLRNIPSVDEIVSSPEIKRVSQALNHENLVKLIRVGLANIRASVKEGLVEELDRKTVIRMVSGHIEKFLSRGQHRIINASGIIIHTNFGRSLLCKTAVENLANIASCYTDLEYDFSSGTRNNRNHHVDWLLNFLTGAEDCVVVNNNAAAVLLCLNTVARGREVIISRGELVEIGGGFRIPEVMNASGCILKEVGTTNKTRLSDYQAVINEKTTLIVKVHTSNYRIVGFTEETSLEELVSLGHSYSIPVLHDLGSGKLFRSMFKNTVFEPSVEDSVETGVDLITFSADKLLGGPQAGVIVGNTAIMKDIKKNPLMRAMRLDKLILAALEATLRQYLNPETAIKNIPTLAMIHLGKTEMLKRTQEFLDSLSKKCVNKLGLKIEEGVSQVGGGSLPLHEIPTYLIGFHPRNITPGKLAQVLRHHDPPVAGRIQKDIFYLDLRTVIPDDLTLLKQAMEKICQ